MPEPVLYTTQPGSSRLPSSTRIAEMAYRIANTRIIGNAIWMDYEEHVRPALEGFAKLCRHDVFAMRHSISEHPGLYGILRGELGRDASLQVLGRARLLAYAYYPHWKEELDYAQFCQADELTSAVELVFKLLPPG